MPALAPSRQPAGPLAWFGSAAGQGAAGGRGRRRWPRGARAGPGAAVVLARRAGAAPPEARAARGAAAARVHGDALRRRRCAARLPLPLASEVARRGAAAARRSTTASIRPTCWANASASSRRAARCGWPRSIRWSPYRARWARHGPACARTGALAGAACARAGFALEVGQPAVAGTALAHGSRRRRRRLQRLAARRHRAAALQACCAR